MMHSCYSNIRRLGKEDGKLEASLNCVAQSCPKDTRQATLLNTTIQAPHAI